MCYLQYHYPHFLTPFGLKTFHHHRWCVSPLLSSVIILLHFTAGFPREVVVGPTWSPGSTESLPVPTMPMSRSSVDVSSLSVHLWLQGICSLAFLLLLRLEVSPPVPILKAQRSFEAHPWPSFSVCYLSRRLMSSCGCNYLQAKNPQISIHSLDLRLVLDYCVLTVWCVHLCLFYIFEV